MLAVAVHAWTPQRPPVASAVGSCNALRAHNTSQPLAEFSSRNFASLPLSDAILQERCYYITLMHGMRDGKGRDMEMGTTRNADGSQSACITLVLEATHASVPASHLTQRPAGRFGRDRRWTSGT